MRFHVAHLADSSRPVAEARAVLQARAPGDDYWTLLEAELERITDGGDACVYPDDLAAVNARSISTSSSRTRRHTFWPYSPKRNSR